MPDSEETLKQSNEILDAIADLKQTFEKRFESVEKRFEAVDAQLESIREGISYNSSRLDRLEGNMLLIRADVRDMGEEMKKDKLALK